VIERIMAEVRDPRIRDELVSDVELGLKIDNSEAAKVYEIEAEAAPQGTRFKRILITPHAQYRMDQRGVTVTEVRLALQMFHKHWADLKSRGQSKRTEEDLARGEPILWTDPRTHLTLVFTTPGGKGDAKIITAYWEGQSDPQPSGPGTCRIGAEGDWSPGVKLLVHPKSELGLPNDADREKEQVLPPESATPKSPSGDGDNKDDHERNIPKFELNRPDNDLPDRPRSLPTPGEEYGHPVKEDYNYVTRRHEVASAEAVADAFLKEGYSRQWRPGRRQHKERGTAKRQRQVYYRKNKSKLRSKAKLRYRKNRSNPQFKRLQQHRRKFPHQHHRRFGSETGVPTPSAAAVVELYLTVAGMVPSIARVAAFHLEAAGAYSPPQQIPPLQRQKRQRGEERIDSRRDYIRNRSQKNRDMKVRHRRLMNYKRYKKYKKWYNEQYRMRGEQGFRRRAQVLTSPQIAFTIGREMVPGHVHSISPMTGMVTFVVGEKDWEHLQSMPILAFMESVVFLSDEDIDAFFDLVDVEIGPEAYEELDEDTVRECADLFDVDPDTAEFASRCEALTGQSDLAEMSADQLGMINEVLVTGYLEGGHARDLDMADLDKGDEDDGELYDWHLIYGEVAEPEADLMPERVATRWLERQGTGIIHYFEQGPANDEINHPGPNVGYAPTSPTHWRSHPDEKESLPSGETGPDKHLDDADPASSRVVPPGDGTLWSGDTTYPKAAATMEEIVRRTAAEVIARARRVAVRLSRADPDRGIWTFQARGSQGRNYTIRIKGVREGGLKNLGKAQVRVSCDCDFFRFQGPEHHAKTHGFLYGSPRGTAASPAEKDPKGVHWACKHAVAAMTLARKYRLSSNLGGLHDLLRIAEIRPNWEWADQWGSSVQTIANRWLGSPVG
jgi:hypothetical protein